MIDDGGRALVRALFELLPAVETDMTIFFRALATLEPPATAADDALPAALAAAYYRPEQLDAAYRERLGAWLAAYHARVAAEGRPPDARRAAMDRSIRYVLRNCLAKVAIDRAEAGDDGGVHELLEVCAGLRTSPGAGLCRTPPGLGTAAGGLLDALVQFVKPSGRPVHTPNVRDPARPHPDPTRLCGRLHRQSDGSLGRHLAVRARLRPLRALPEDRLAGARRVALIVIDGLGAELLAYLDQGQRLAPYRAATITSVFPPTTASAVTTFMSGLAPQQHGLTGWFMHFRRLGAVTAVLPFVPRYARQGLREVGIEPGAVIDAPSFTAGLTVPAALLMPADLVDSGFSRLLGAGARRDAYRDLDGFGAALAAFVAGRDEARYLYAYWPELDRLAHLHGPSAAAVAAHYDALAATLVPVLPRRATVAPW